MDAGRLRGARQHFLRARDLDTLRFRADSRINDINRSVGSSSTGAELVDAEEIFSKQSPNGAVGSELVYEHVHMTPAGNYLLARAMFLQIASKMPAADGQSATQNGVLSQADCERLLAFTPTITLALRERCCSGSRNLLLQISSTTPTNCYGWRSRRSVPDENPEATSAEYQWAIAQNPNDRVLHYNFGLFLFEYDRNAAIEQLRQSRPWDEFPVFTPDGTPL